MNFEDEQYVRLYTRKTITSKRLGWEGRTVLWHLMCEADRAGIIEVGDGDLVEAIMLLLVDVPEDVISSAIPRLMSQGVTVRHGTKLLLMRFIEAQDAKRSDAVRAKEYRDRRRAGLATPRDVVDTPRDVESHHVTARHDSSLSALLPLPSNATPSERASARKPVADGGFQPNWDERETPCPLDLVAKLKSSGVHVQLSEALKVDVLSVVAELEEFVGYWTVGKGTGQRRRHWAALARERVRKRAGEGLLKAPGAIEHGDRPLTAEQQRRVDRALRGGAAPKSAPSGPAPLANVLPTPAPGAKP